MDIVRTLIFFVLICCIYNMLKISIGKKSSRYSSKYSGFDYNNTTSYFGNNVKCHYRTTKNGKSVYVRAHKRNRR